MLCNLAIHCTEKHIFAYFSLNNVMFFHVIKHSNSLHSFYYLLYIVIYYNIFIVYYCTHTL